MKIFITIIALLIGQLAIAQEKEEKKTAKEKFNEWLKNRVSIRKTFDGSSKDEGKPATFFWNKDYENDNEEYVTIDLGIKITEWQPFENTTLLFLPKFEWHKDGREAAGKKKNDVSAGLNIEYYPFDALNKMRPWFMGSADIQRDIVKELTTFKPKFFLSLYGNKQWMPGSQTNNCKGVFVLRYYPYSGIEHFKATDVSKVNATYWANRFFAEYWPITSPRKFKGTGEERVVDKEEKRYLQFTIDLTHRKVLEDKLFDRGDLYWIAIGANLYFDGAGKYGIGLEYTKGDDPAANFVETKKLSVGLKIKL